MTDQESIKVAVRIRPINRIEACSGTDNIAFTIDSNQLALQGHNFSFDYVFGPETSQQLLYHSTIKDAMLPKLFQGFNATVLAYGQTGSGKC